MKQSLFLPAELDFNLSNFHSTSSEIKLSVISTVEIVSTDRSQTYASAITEANKNKARNNNIFMNV